MEPFTGESAPPDPDAPLGIVVVNYRSSDLLATHLAAITPSRLVKICVVDNYSSEAERLSLADLARAHDWDLVTLPTNGGFGVGANAGAARAEELGCTSVLLLNPDAQVELGVVLALRLEVTKDPAVLVAPRIVDSLGRTYSQGSVLDLTNGSIGRARPDDVAGRYTLSPSEDSRPWLTGACLAVSLQLWNHVDGMDPSYFLYWEDVDFSVRCEDAGAELVVRGDLLAIHDEGGTQTRSGDAKSDVYYYYNCRNRLMFGAKHLGRARARQWLRTTRDQSWQILLRGGRRQLVRSPRPLWAVVRGSLQGAKMIAARPRRHRPIIGKRVLVAHPSSDLYGSDRMLVEVVSALTSSGADVTVALPGEGPLKVVLESSGARVIIVELPALRRSMLSPSGLVAFVVNTLRLLPGAIQIARQFSTAVVYVNTVISPTWLLVARLAGRRSVCHVHEAEQKMSTWSRRVLAAPLALADTVIVNSEFTRAVLGQSSPETSRRSQLIPNGLDLPRSWASPRSALDGRIRLVFVGRLSPRKGPQVAAEAVSLLVDRGHDIELDIVGSVFEGYEWFEDELRAMITAQGLSDRVRLVGFQKDVWASLSASDIVLVPSVGDESFGNAAIEAVGAARPTVVSAQPGLLEAVDGLSSVVSVEPGSAAALGDAVVEIIERWPQFRNDALSDAKEVRARFSTEVFRERVLAVMSALTSDDSTMTTAPARHRG